MKTLYPYNEPMRSEFTDRIDVVCPRCGSKALVLGADLNLSVAVYEKEVVFRCKVCGYEVRYGNTPKLTVNVSKQGQTKYSRTLHLNKPVDPFFGFALWYCEETDQGLLWAYNVEHLSAIEAYIVNSAFGRNGQTHNNLDDRLVQSLGSAKNRTYLIRLIGRLKKNR